MSILDGALRQLKHNDGSDDIVFAYDKEIVEREFAHLEQQLARAEIENQQVQASTSCLRWTDIRAAVGEVLKAAGPMERRDATADEIAERVLEILK